MLSRAMLQVGVRASSIAQVADGIAIGAMQNDASFGSMRESSKVNARAGDRVKAVVAGGAENMCHGNIGSPLICPLPASCGQNGLVLAGILGSRSGCDANKEFLFEGPGYHVTSNLILKILENHSFLKLASNHLSINIFICNIQKYALYRSFMALLGQLGNVTQLTVKNTPLKPPPTPIGDLTLPRIGA